MSDCCPRDEHAHRPTDPHAVTVDKEIDVHGLHLPEPRGSRRHRCNGIGELGSDGTVARECTEGKCGQPSIKSSEMHLT